MLVRPQEEECIENDTWDGSEEAVTEACLELDQARMGGAASGWVNRWTFRKSGAPGEGMKL